MLDTCPVSRHLRFFFDGDAAAAGAGTSPCSPFPFARFAVGIVLPINTGKASPILTFVSFVHSVSSSLQSFCQIMET